MNDNKAFAIFAVSICLMGLVIGGIQSYQDGEVEKLKLQLKIEQEKNQNNDTTKTEIGHN